jgi:hypothetical protein
VRAPTLIAWVLSLALVVAGCGDSPSEDPSDRSATTLDTTGCPYDNPPPPYSGARQVKVSGGATCREATIIIKLGPEFGAQGEVMKKVYLNGKRVLRGSSWSCAVRGPLSDGNPAQPVRCKDQGKRIDYLFIPKQSQ